MLIKGYLPQEFDAIYAIERECFQPPIRFTEEEMMDYLNKEELWKAFDSDVLVGYMLLNRTRRGRTYINSIAVIPEARGKGFGKSLMQQAEADARNRINLHVHVDNPAQHFYSSLGYKTKHIISNFYDDGSSALFMEKHL